MKILSIQDIDFWKYSSDKGTKLLFDIYHNIKQEKTDDILICRDDGYNLCLKFQNDYLLTISTILTGLKNLSHFYEGQDSAIYFTNDGYDYHIYKHDNLTMDAWIEREQEVYPDMPSKEKTITEAEIIAGWDINKYNAYITAQTYATVYGEMVHPDGSISNARKRLTKALNAPTSVSGQGRDLMVTTQLPAFTQEEVDKQFFELQSKQREYQAKYNNYRYEIECIIQADEDRKQQEYIQKLNEVTDVRKAVQAKYIRYVIDRQNYYRGLKIAIPEQLVDIYKEIQELGK